MSYDIGDVSIYKNRAYWNIPYFMDIPQEEYSVITSPAFTFVDREWRIAIYPNGMRSQDLDSIGWFGVTAYNTNPHENRVELNIRIGLLGESDEEILNFKAINSPSGYCRIRLLRHSALETKKEKMLVDGSLNIFMSVEDPDYDTTKERIVFNGYEKVTEDFKKLLRTGELTDVVIEAMGVEIKVHRFVLAARSPVFLAMLSHNTKEKNEGVIQITDIHPDVMKEFINFLYAGSVEKLCSENVYALYTTAEKYQVQDLKSYCIKYMICGISVLNFCDVIFFAVMHDEETLKEACINFFRQHSLEVIETEMWKAFMDKHPTVCNDIFMSHLKSLKWD